FVGCHRAAAALINGPGHLGHGAGKLFFAQNVINRAGNARIAATIHSVIDRFQIVRQILAKVVIAQHVTKAARAAHGLKKPLCFGELTSRRIELFFHAGELLQVVRRSRRLERGDTLGHYRTGRADNDGYGRREYEFSHLLLLWVCRMCLSLISAPGSQISPLVCRSTYSRMRSRSTRLGRTSSWGLRPSAATSTRSARFLSARRSRPCPRLSF